MRKDRLNILYEDKYILVVNKPCKLLTVSTDKEKEHTLFHKVYKYIKAKNKASKIFIVHRLDKDTSGIVLFAKTEKIKRILQTDWEKAKIGYIAIVEGTPKEKVGTIKSYIYETNTLLCYSSNEKKAEGKLAITNYSLVLSNDNYSMLDISVTTSRKNQVRVHMQDIKLPIIGDKKYGSKTNPINRLGLHAYKLEFAHPVTKEPVVIETDVPNEFVNLIRR